MYNGLQEFYQDFTYTQSYMSIVLFFYPSMLIVSMLGFVNESRSKREASLLPQVNFMTLSVGKSVRSVYVTFLIVVMQ